MAPPARFKNWPPARAYTSETLTPRQEAFIREYDANGNGTRAYMASHPECRSVGAAAVEAHRYPEKT
jgi:hypothetical protein